MPAVRLTAAEFELERHIPALRRFAWALTRRGDEADDLVQDCLERALARAGSFRGQGERRAWLFSILHNLFVSHRRRAARRATLPLEDAPEPARPPNQEHAVSARELLAALERLPEDQRVVLLLVGVEDLSYEEAARALGIPIGTVMSRLSRGRERLRRLVAGEAEAAPPALRVVGESR